MVSVAKCRNPRSSGELEWTPYIMASIRGEAVSEGAVVAPAAMSVVRSRVWSVSSQSRVSDRD